MVFWLVLPPPGAGGVLRWLLILNPKETPKRRGGRAIVSLLGRTLSIKFLINYILRMKKILFLFAALFSFHSIRADEGMWLLKLMEQQHLADSLRKAGLKLRPEQLYSENETSLREVVGIFGNGCTGEVISPKGLLLTNNHCGFSYIHAMSTLQHNYLQDGFFAKSQSEELRVPNLTFTFVRRIVEVTDEVVAQGKEEGVNEYVLQSQMFTHKVAKKLREQSDLKDLKGLRTRIVPFFGGNRFYMFYEQEYSDIRLVANPPQSVAQFGFNSDNWMWPRHNADFAVFRIYADENGQPADYAATNRPLATQEYLPISLAGVQEKDYAMVMGFPGTTTRYLTASQIRLRTQSINAPTNMVGEVRLAEMKAMMNADAALNLSLAQEYMQQGNVVKNYGGMNESVRRRGLIAQKEMEEVDFRRWAAESGQPEYRDIIDRIDRLAQQYADTLYDLYLYNSTFNQIGFTTMHPRLTALYDALAAKKYDQAKALAQGIYKGLPHDKNELRVRHQLAAKTLPYWFRHRRLTPSPEVIDEEALVAPYLDLLFNKSLFRDSLSFAKFLAKPTAKKLEEDPLYELVVSMGKVITPLADALRRYNHAMRPLNKIYVRALCEKNNWTKAPDANFTLRMTYGHVDGYAPRDGISYAYETTLDGMLEKESATDPDYFIHPRLRDLYHAKDFGRYARPDGKLPTCFITTNDITGGNSGSPVLNAKGELIGCAFDGNIESLSSDLAYYPKMQRCIAADIRFILWTLDIFGGSKYLFEEMDIRQN